MRQIRFRGYSKELKKWFYGSLMNEMDWGSFILYDAGFECRQQVVPETVGQFTGLYDKDGRKIFEDDIIRSPRGINYPVSYVNGEFVANINIVMYTKDIWDLGQVVGNIHDNPELLTPQP